MKNFIQSLIGSTTSRVLTSQDRREGEKWWKIIFNDFYLEQHKKKWIWGVAGVILISKKSLSSPPSYRRCIFFFLLHNHFISFPGAPKLNHYNNMSSEKKNVKCIASRQHVIYYPKKKLAFNQLHGRELKVEERKKNVEKQTNELFDSTCSSRLSSESCSGLGGYRVSCC